MKRSMLILCCGALLVVHSCKKKDSNPSVTPISGYSSMEEVFGKMKLPYKTVVIDAATGGSFYGNSGTRYIFPPNSFQTASGASVTGSVDVKVCEYLKKGDMMFSKMLPISNNEPLISGGEIDVSASQGGQPLFMKPGKAFQANMPAKGAIWAGGHMVFFKGQLNQDTTLNRVNWVHATDTQRMVVFIEPMKSDDDDTLGIVSDTLTQCNADQFMTSPNYQNFNVTITVTGATLPSSNKVYGYTYYDTFKGIWPLGAIGSYANGVYNEKHVPDIAVHFVVFTIIGGKFYGGTLGATPHTGQNYTVNLTEADPDTFKGQLNNL